jgi:hypothetical protein
MNMTNRVTEMNAQNTSQVAFILSTLGGLLIVVNGIFSSMWFMTGELPFIGMMGGFGGMMSGFHEMMGGLGIPLSFMSSFSLIGLVSGIFVIIGALMLRAQPSEHRSWGLVILVFSITSFLGTGGFILGAILGVIGGSLAITWMHLHD